MRQYQLSLSIVAILLLAACTKGNNKGGGGAGGGTTTGNYAFANTEYTGTSTQVSEYYPKPISIHFNADSTMSAYSCFNWSLNGHLVIEDSIHGKITNVGSDGNGGTTISVTIDSTGDEQQMTISSDKSGLTGGSISGSPAPGAVQFQFVGLKLAPTTPPSLLGNWSGDSIVRDGSFEGYDYPDVSTFSFFADGTTGYLRYGLTYPNGPGTTPVTAKYWQYGSRVYFYGLNENYARLIPYFGVISPDGTTMYVDTDLFSLARLPVYGDTNAPYGPDGETPVIHKY